MAFSFIYRPVSAGGAVIPWNSAEWEFEETNDYVVLTNYIGESNDVQVPTTCNSKQTIFKMSALDASADRLNSVTFGAFTSILQDSTAYAVAGQAKNNSTWIIDDSSDSSHCYNSSYWTGMMTDDRYIINSYVSGSPATMIVPNIVDGRPVVLATDFTYPANGITSIEFEPGVRIYNDSMYEMFELCKSLTCINNYPEGVTDMGFAFRETNVKQIPDQIPNSVISLYSTFTNTQIEKMPTIPNSVQNMVQTFWGCGNLTQLSEIPNSINSLSYTFDGCNKLMEPPIIPNSVIEMSSTFNRCIRLVNAPIVPDSVENINNICNGCYNLKYVDYIGNNTINRGNAFSNCYNLATVNYVGGNSDFVNVHSERMFYQCENMVEVNTIENIGNAFCMFMYCSNLKYINNFHNVSSALDSAFQNCSNLVGINSITISGTDSVGTSYVFQNMPYLEYVNFDEISLQNMPSMFRNCSNLKCVNINSTNIINMSGLFSGVYENVEVHIPAGVHDTYNAYMNSYGNNSYFTLYQDL